MARRPDALNTAAGLQFTPEGQPYYLTQSGARSFLPPLVAAQERDPRAKAWAARQGTTIDYSQPTPRVTDASRPGESMWQNAGTWNDRTGTWDRGFNWNTVATLGAGAIAAGPLIGAMLPGGGAGASAASAAPAAGGAGALPSSVPGGLGAWSGGGNVGFFSTVGSFLGSPTGSEIVRQGGNAVGTVLNNRATGKMADAQLQATREALGFERDVYDRAQQDYQPWKALTPVVTARIGDLLTTRRPPVTAESVYGSGQLPSGGVSMGAMRSVGRSQTPAAATMAPRMVTVEAPNGQRKVVSEAEADHYVARGARVVA